MTNTNVTVTYAGFDKDGDAMVSYNNGRGFYINSQALQRVGEREELQICCGDRVQITVDDKQHTGQFLLRIYDTSVDTSVERTGYHSSHIGLIFNILIQA